MAQRQFRTGDTDRWKHGFGNKLNDIVVNTNSVLANEYVAFGGAEGTTPVLSSFNNGDLLMVHNTRGPNANDAITWELNRKKAGELEYELTRAYQNSVVATDPERSQIIKAVVCRKFSLIDGATLTIQPWDQTKGGIGLIIADTVDLSGGTVDLRNSGFMAGLTGGDYAGGRAESWSDHALSPYGNYPSAGDPSAGDRAVGRPAKGNAPGRGSGTNSGSETQPGAGGAGNKNAGSNGSQGTSTAYLAQGGDYGIGGEASGNDDLSSLVLSGAGSVGAGFVDGSGWYPSRAAGKGSASLVIICRKFIAPYRIIADGSNAAASTHNNQGGSSGSAGSNVLIQGMDIELGTDVITANPGTGVLRAGASSIGRIAVRYSRAIAGETDPEVEAVLDTIYNQFPATQGGALMAAI